MCFVLHVFFCFQGKVANNYTSLFIKTYMKGFGMWQAN
jgi:hypothetical protein